ncbi:MAG TPA: hypothetical protein VLC74_05475 [Rhizomicrobium sp.]|nr:hypothetical protein [Rhizomicrobium sp.]
MERLEDDAEMPAAEARERVLAKMRDVGAGDGCAAGGRRLEACRHHQERGLAGAGGPDERHGFAGFHS